MTDTVQTATWIGERLDQNDRDLRELARFAEAHGGAG
jgi:hypothetical protein